MELANLILAIFRIVLKSFIRGASTMISEYTYI